MDTKCWGPPLWDALYFVGYGYDLNPAPASEKREHYRRFFLELGHILPCKYCRATFATTIEALGGIDQYLDRKNMGMFQFVYDLKNRVNHKLVLQETEKLKDAVESLSENPDNKTEDVWGELHRVCRDVVKTQYNPPYNEVLAKYRAADVDRRKKKKNTLPRD